MKLKIKYCPEWDHFYVDTFHIVEVETVVGITGYCDEPNRAILNDKQHLKLKEYIDAMAK